MGLNSNSDSMFLNVSCGKLINKGKNIEARSFSGKILSIKQVDDTYEEKTIHKIKVEISDGDESAIISFTENSWYAKGFFQRIHKADLTKELVLGVSGSDKNEKISFCWMKQGDNVIKKDESFVLPPKVEFNGEKVTDWGGWHERVADILGKLNYNGNDQIDDDLPF